MVAGPLSGLKLENVMNSAIRITLACAVGAMALGPLPSALLPAGQSGAAFAEKGGNGGGNSGGSASSSAGGSQAGGNGHGQSPIALVSADTPGHGNAKGNGALASELKGLNAVKANPNALLHASPNSQVGRIATYYQAALATDDARADQDKAAAALTLAAAAVKDAKRDLAVALNIGTASDAEIAVLKQAVQDAKAAAAVAQADYDATAAAIAARERAEQDALLVASDGRTLSDDALAYLRDQLGL